MAADNQVGSSPWPVTPSRESALQSQAAHPPAASPVGPAAGVLGLPDPLVLTHSTLSDLLWPSRLVVGRRACRRHRVDALLVWGRRPSGRWGTREASRRALPLWRVEDAFLRSVDPAPAPPFGILLDDEGIHYDASQPSRLDRLIGSALTTAQQQRARDLAAAWRQRRMSKINAAVESPAPDGDYVLVVDQVADDAAIRLGLAGPASFQRMLEQALADFPDHRIVVKTHPNVVSGRRRGHFGASQLAHPRLELCADGGHPATLLAGASAVYVVTSQMGFEALIWGKPVHCFGMPFYGGWGLTEDRVPPPAHGARRPGVALEALVHACLIDYARYLDPETLRITSPERLIEHVALQRQQRATVPRDLQVFGIARWKRNAVRRFQRGLHPSRVRFRSFHAAPDRGDDRRCLVWGQRLGRGLRRSQGPLIRAEDGFLRSVGQGWWLRWVPPISWVIDHRGIYYDASGPSDLETYLASHTFSDTERERAARLRRWIVAAGLTKYNLRSPRWQRPTAIGERTVLLVPGQVEVDLSIRFGMPPDATVHSNLELLQAVRHAHPDAFLIYKPHPDVVSGRQRPGPGEQEAPRHCDLVLPQAPIEQLLEAVDGVHVRTSITGFEALMRGIPVTTWGMPFYAGWGLTSDQLRCPRRGRRLQLDELLHAALIHYPVYVSLRTGLYTTPERAVEELRQLRDYPDAFRAPLQRWLDALGIELSPPLRHRLSQLWARLQGWR